MLLKLIDKKVVSHGGSETAEKTSCSSAINTTVGAALAANIRSKPEIVRG